MSMIRHAGVTKKKGLGKSGATVDAIASAGAMLGAMFASRAKKPAPTAKKKSGKRENAGLQNVTSLRKVSAPQIASTVISHKAMKHTFSLDFDECQLPITTTAAGLFGFGGTSVANFEVDPNVNTGGIPGFGNAVQTASSVFRRFRIVNLHAWYVPIQNPNSTGSFCVAHLDDVTFATAPTYPQLLACDRNVVTPTWSGVPIDLSQVKREWLWVHEGTSSVADQRQTQAGTLYIATVNNGAAVNQVCGFLRLKGRIEFADLGPASLPLPASSGSSSLLPTPLPQLLPGSCRPADVLPTDTSREVSGQGTSVPTPSQVDGRWYIPSSSGQPSALPR